MRDSIAKGLDHRKGLIVVIADAASMSDASLCAVLTQIITTERIENDFDGINPMKSVILVDDSKLPGPYNTCPEYLKFDPTYVTFKRHCNTRNQERR